MIDAEKVSLPKVSHAHPAQRDWHYHTFRAMNTEVYLWLYSRNGALARYIEQHFARFEQRLSRFKTNSELTQLNRCPCTECPVSAELYAALEVAFWAAQATNGLYDPTILPALINAGYDRSFDLLEGKLAYQFEPGQAETVSAAATCPARFAFRDVQLDRLRRTVTRPPQLQIDLGGMGKGWAVDRAADLLQGEGPFLLNAGGDLYAHGFPANQQGWEIELVHPIAPEATLGRLYLANRALATSTLAKRRWKKGSQVMHHLIDPRTGRSAQTDALSVTVIAERTVLADIYAKVSLILGVQAGLAYLEQLPNVEGFIYTEAGHSLYTTGFGELFEPASAGSCFQVTSNKVSSSLS